jgi:1-deoxy-D-xylulose-5-phosphate reductoisomerase
MTPVVSAPGSAAPSGVALLGSTGSIGTSTLRVLARHPDRFRPVALTANGNVDALAAQVAVWAPAFVGLVSGEPPSGSGWRRGAACLVEAATHPDVSVVLNAVVGAAGLHATLAALGAGRKVALANKETLVVAGEVVMAAARAGGGSLVPVDSEHSAILQCLAGRRAEEVRRLVITASGGPFRTWPDDRIAVATVADALNHPTWRMGSKISIDSATLANKALEVIEAHHLFGVPYERIEVVVHPQSVVHSFVEFVDGSVLAQLGVPSMELPILYALTHPERIGDSGVPRYDPVAAGPLAFEPVRHEAFPTLGLGLAAGRSGGAAPAVFNAANEEAVAAFLAGRLAFGQIPVRIDAALTDLADHPGHSLDALLAADAEARRHVHSRLPC